MKILIVNTVDKGGGAAIAANRLNDALIENGVESNILVQRKYGANEWIIQSERKIHIFFNSLIPLLDAFPKVFYKKRSKGLFSTAWVPVPQIVSLINKINPDIVHLHWINAGMIRIEDLQKIKAPIVWSLHDMWAFTGGCHYTEQCQGFKNNCGYCKVLNSSKPNDLSKIIFNRKLKVYSRIRNLNFVGLSQWITKEACFSSLIKNKPIFNLPNPIDTSKFKPLDIERARRAFNLDESKKLILFGAFDATIDKRKGFEELKQALQLVHYKEVELVVFGANRTKLKPEELRYITHFVGELDNEYEMSMLYSLADVMLVPSIQENLSNVIMESLSCGTPVVAFDIGGNPDLIKHKFNGYLAKPYSTKDLAFGIEWVLDHKTPEKLSKNARDLVLRNFDKHIVAKKYIELYKSILKN